MNSIEQRQREQHILEVLSSLSYRAGELHSYLLELVCGVSQLVCVDWTVVTLCKGGFERVLASNLDLGGEQVSSLHGQLTGTVIQTGRSLVIENAQAHPEYGQIPEGYCAYLGVPLRPPHGEVIGTICSFHRQPRRFEAAEVHIAEVFAERAATAIDNYQLYQQQRRFNEALEAEVSLRTSQLQAAQAKLVERERLAAIGEFAASIVHEVRNPLTTIMMGLAYFKKTKLSSSSQERLALALSEAERLECLLREILLYAKPQVLHLTEIEVNELVGELLGPLRSLPEAAGRQIEFLPAATAVWVLGDRDKLKQVCINLVSNACEAVAAGEVVRWAVESPQGSGEVCLKVRNGGQPISPEVLPRLTEAFYTTKETGTGLGLAIVKRIVEAHQGKFLIESSAQAGTCVTVQLPTISLLR